jgi:hypothetical protein
LTTPLDRRTNDSGHLIRVIILARVP